MPDVRTFRAATMREALDRVRADLGQEAVILATRQIPVRRILPWGRREEVEITAGIGIETKRTVRTTRAAAPVVTAPPENLVFASLTEQERRAAEIVKELRRRNAGGPFSDQGLAALQNGTNELTDATATLSKRLDSIERMLADLGRREVQKPDELTPEQQQIRGRLVTNDVDEAIATEFARRVEQEIGSESLTDASLVTTELMRVVESELKCCGPVSLTPGRRRIVALVGPTGVGKTTTIAKLAAEFRLHQTARIGLITADTHRIGAVDHLRKFAEIIGLPMKVVPSASAMRAALDEFANLDLVLIDTAGRSPRDAERLAELKPMLAAAAPHETHLVLPVGTGGKALLAAADRFRLLEPTSIIASKLDEAVGAGPLVELCRTVGLPMSYVTTGQDIPDDIVPAQADAMARAVVLGTEVLGPNLAQRTITDT